MSSFKSKKTKVEHLHCKAALIEKPVADFVKSTQTVHRRLSITSCLCLSVFCWCSSSTVGHHGVEVVRTAGWNFVMNFSLPLQNNREGSLDSRQFALIP